MIQSDSIQQQLVAAMQRKGHTAELAVKEAKVSILFFREVMRDGTISQLNLGRASNWQRRSLVRKLSRLATYCGVSPEAWLKIATLRSDEALGWAKKRKNAALTSAEPQSNGDGAITKEDWAFVKGVIDGFGFPVKATLIHDVIKARYCRD